MSFTATAFPTSLGKSPSGKGGRAVPAAMEANIAADPLAYPVIRGTGGFRKARWSRGATGKSGGVRAIFYYFVSGDTVFSRCSMQRTNWRI
jgi:hypothetical protein